MVVGSCGETPSGSLTSAPEGAFTGPLSSGSFVACIHAPSLPRISSAIFPRLESAIKFRVSFGSNTRS